jgi:predicted AAA+ superfamily ATPase
VDNRLARIVATGSAASVLREAGRESGLGRWDEIQLEGLTFREFSALSSGGGAADGRAPSVGTASAPGAGVPAHLERFLTLGGFPEHATSDDYPLVRERLRSDIVDRAIRRDLTVRVDDPERLRRLFVYLIQQSGSEQNNSDRAADLGVDPRTVARWIELLEDTFLIAVLRRGSTSAKAAARLRGRPKLYAADHGVVTAFAEAPPGDSEVRGRVFEAVVFRHLREVARRRSGELFYLRWGNDLEVDFVLDVDRERIAIEVTQSVQPKVEKRKALARAADRAGARSAVLVHGGLAEGKVDGVAVVPAGRFLADPWSALGGGGG